MNDDNATWKNLIMKRVVLFAVNHAIKMLNDALQEYGERMLYSHRDKLKQIVTDLGDFSDSFNKV